MAGGGPMKLIVVGIDGSAAAFAAVRWAVQEAVTAGAAVEVVHSWYPQIIADIVFTRPQELHVASLALLSNGVAEAVAGLSPAPIVTQTSLRGTPVSVLLDRAAHADLLVLGVHGRTSVRDLVFGHIEAACVKEARCPVIVVDADGRVVRRHPEDDGKLK